jgi:hypothetical protein
LPSSWILANGTNIWYRYQHQNIIVKAACKVTAYLLNFSGDIKFLHPTI